MFPTTAHEKSYYVNPLTESVAYTNYNIPNPIEPILVKKVTGSYCSCVDYVKGKTGFAQTIGTARRWPVNAKFGVVGSVIILNESRSGHVAIILAINEIGYVLDEANYVTCVHTQGRVIPFNDPQIIGFWFGS